MDKRLTSRRPTTRRDPLIVKNNSVRGVAGQRHHLGLFAAAIVVFGGIVLSLGLLITGGRSADSETSVPTEIATNAVQSVNEAQLDKPIISPLSRNSADTAVKTTSHSSNQADVATPKQSPERVAVQELLRAGEFHNAFEVALNLSDARQSTTLSHYVLAAQLSEKEFEFAPQRATSRKPVSPRKNAGGSGADFDSLIELITTTVSPDTWEEVGGPGTVSSYETGVRVDPRGQLAKVSELDESGKLQDLSAKLKRAGGNADVNGPSSLRLVSLPRLERAVARKMAEGSSPEEAMLHLAGLTAVRHIFVFPEEGDVVVAGLAEGWKIDEEGCAVGRESGQPMLRLDDLVTMLRTFAPSSRGNFGCSINPREQNLKRVKEFVEASQAAGPLAAGQRRRWLRELRDRMGLQDIEVYGVPRNTHVAQVIVDADYRMKLVGIGKLDGGPDIPDIFKLMRRHQLKDGLPLQALRWWLTMKYDRIAHSPERDAFELCGSSVLVQSENQFVTAQGKHLSTGKTEQTNRLFAQNFTDHYAELASREKVFAELQDVFDLAMMAAICHNERLFGRAEWDLGVFAPGGRYQVAEVETPETIESVMNHRLYGRREIVVQVAGGVVGNVRSLLGNETLRSADDALSGIRDDNRLPKSSRDRWWWDAAP